MELFPSDLVVTPTRSSRSECPRCSTVLEVIDDPCEERYFCHVCGQCWRESAAGFRGVDPISCPGCACHDRSECLALFASSFPLFGASLD